MPTIIHMYRLRSFSGPTTSVYNYSPTHESDNLFTVIIGLNGTGKSRLLGEIAKFHSEFSKNDEEFWPNQPKKILALTNIVTDNFPFRRRLSENYRYLGLRQASNSVSTMSLNYTLGNFLVELRASQYDNLNLKRLLKTLGCNESSYLTIRITQSSSEKQSWNEKITQKYFQTYGMNLDKLEYNSLQRELQDLWFLILRNSKQIYSNEYIIDEYDIGRVVYNFSRKINLAVSSVLSILRSELGVRFLMKFGEPGEQPRDRQYLSAGQSMFLSMIMRIAATIEKDSLILIDEPEVGLHPGWQSDFIKILKQNISSRLESHFIIATHSPFLVSNADEVLVPSAVNGEFRPLEGPHQGMTIEEVIYRVFETRVIGNSEVEEDLTALMEWIAYSSGDAGPTEEVIKTANRLRQLSNQETSIVNSILDEFDTEMNRLR